MRLPTVVFFIVKGRLLKGCGKAEVGVQGCRKKRCSWQSRASAQ
jgi:hypothetical protein